MHEIFHELYALNERKGNYSFWWAKDAKGSQQRVRTLDKIIESLSKSTADVPTN